MSQRSMSLRLCHDYICECYFECMQIVQSVACLRPFRSRLLASQLPQTVELLKAVQAMMIDPFMRKRRMQTDML